MNADSTKADEQRQQDVPLIKVYPAGTTTTASDELVFYAGTDKARVISEILEKRGWSRTRDRNVTNFTLKWCLDHQVDWSKFQAGKQLISNIPGQKAFSDKINLWHTVRDYLQRRHMLGSQCIQTFLAMTFVLDDENEVAEFLRVYKKQNRTWIYKPRYNYAGRGITVLPVHSDLSTIFKVKVGANNRPQHEPKSPGYLMQQYISRPLLIKGRKFDIRVHWLVAWTKPLLVFYNHHASVVRLSLNLYREFDCDRTTHLTNLSIQETHSRYAYLQESTGMTISQLNQYFNQCFRPFHPKLCQDWVLTVMQERMQTIIRHVMRASKDKLGRDAGQFGFYGCDFLLDENFRIWLLEVNDNPGVGWGNTMVNTTTKPLIEETLSIVCECFEKHKSQRPLLPISCLKNYQLIYNEDDDTNRLLLDDNQIFTEQLSLRYAIKEPAPRKTPRRALPQINAGRTTTHTTDAVHNSTNDILLPLMNIDNPGSSVITATSTSVDASLENNENIESGHFTRRKRPTKSFQSKSPLLTHPSGSTVRVSKTSIKRTLSKSNTLDAERRKPSDSLPIIVDKKRCIQRSDTTLDCTDVSSREKRLSKSRATPRHEEHEGKDDSPLVNRSRAKPCILN